MDNREVINDFTRRYQGTYIIVKFPESSEENLFLVDSIDREDEERVAVMSLSSPEYGKIKLNYGTSHTLKFKRPKAGVFQNGIDACLYRRSPQRQWRVGVCHENSTILPVWNGLYPAKHNMIDYESVANAFQGTTFSFKDALEMLASMKYRSVALRNNFSLVQSMQSTDGYFMMYFDHPVAFVGKDGSINKIIDNNFKVQIENAEYS